MKPPTPEEIAEALDTACGLLETVGTVYAKGADGLCGAPGECANCENEITHPDDFGHEDNHSAECDIPDVFAVRDEWLRATERAKLEEEVGREPDAI